MQEEDFLNQILSGQLTPEQALAQGSVGGAAAGRAGFMQNFLTWLNDNPNASAAQGALSGYQNELNTGGAEAPALQQLMAQYQQQIGGNIPESSQMADLLQAITRGVNGTNAVNPMVERQLNEAEQQRRTRLFQQLGPGYETSSAGIEALNTLGSTRAGTIDQLNQQDLQNVLAGYVNLLSGTQNRQAQTANQYLGLSGNQQQRQSSLLNQYLGLNEDTRLNVAGNLQGYTGLTNFTEQQRTAEYANEINRRMQQAGLQAQVATAPYTGVDYSSLINSYTGALNASTQRQTGPVTQGSGAGYGQLAGTLIGGGIGAAVGGPAGLFTGAGLGSSLGGAAGGGGAGGGYQAPNLWNMPSSWSSGSGGGGFDYGSFYTQPYYG